MNLRVLFAILMLAGLCAVPTFAQTAADTSDPFAPTIKSESSFYPIRLDVVRIDQSPYGYRVIYRKGAVDFAEAYVPNEWFVPGGKATLVRANEPSYPYMIVYLKDGKFSFVKLYVKDNQKDPSWGILPGGASMADKFKVEEIKPEF